MGKVLELSKETYERLLALAQQRACTPEELLHTLLVDAEQAQYYHANQQMLAQGILASMPRTPGSAEAAFTRGCQDICVTFLLHGYPLSKQHHELIERGFPVTNRLRPLFGHMLEPHI
jgi:hypothetical protein